MNTKTLAESIMVKNSDQIEVGMTYEEVKSLLGSAGLDESCANGEYKYVWLSENKQFDYSIVYFTMSDDGELIVSKIVD